MSWLRENRRRLLKLVLGFALLHYAVLLSIQGITFLLIAIPPSTYNVDSVILELAQMQQVLRAPRSLLRALWPGEQNYTLLNLAFSMLNSLLWGMAGAGLRILLRPGALK